MSCGVMINGQKKTVAGNILAHIMDLTPIGIIIPMTGIIIPPGYLLCDGREVSRTD